MGKTLGMVGFTASDHAPSPQRPRTTQLPSPSHTFHDLQLSMQREALPDVAVKPNVQAEPKDQLSQFRCASNKVISIAKSIPKSLKFCGSLW